MPLRQIFQSIHLVTFPTISDHAQDELLETKYQRLKKHFSFIVISMQASTKLFLKGNIILILKFKFCGQIVERVIPNLCFYVEYVWGYLPANVHDQPN